MSIVNRLFAPRIDHRGMSTPSEASRIFLVLTMVGTGVWSWNATDGNLMVWFSLTLLVATPILSIGWYLLSLVARNRRGELLTPKVQYALEAKGRWPHHSRKPKPQDFGGLNVSFIERGETQRRRLSGLPALSFVPLPRAPPNGCCPTTAPVGLSLM